MSTRGRPMYKYDRYTTAAVTSAGLYRRHTVVSRLSFTKLWAACESNRNNKGKNTTGAESPRRGVGGFETYRIQERKGVPHPDFWGFQPVSEESITTMTLINIEGSRARGTATHQRR